MAVCIFEHYQRDNNLSTMESLPMIKYVVVIPYVHRAYFRQCMDTLKLKRPDIKVVIVDNTEVNRGVAGSWNIGIKTLKEENADWLIIVSAAMRFGVAGGLDMIKQLEDHPSADIVRFEERDHPERQFDNENKANNPPYPVCFYWHCTAISDEVVRRVGKFDQNFHPIYFEDTDYDLRIKKAGFNKSDILLPIDARSDSFGHGINLGGVKSPATPLVAYFATKWGRHPGAPELGEYRRPFNDMNNKLAFWPPAEGGTWDE